VSILEKRCPERSDCTLAFSSGRRHVSPSFFLARAIAAARGLPCLAEESPGLALGIIAVESGLPATFLYQRKHRVDRWCCDLDEAAHFLDGGDECIDL
jgi:hypothetical protein